MELPRLVEMMQRVHDGEAWHGPSVMTALEGVMAAQAAAHPIPGAHSIWEIALHIVAWRREVHRRLSGKPPSTPEEGDWPESLGDDEAAWTRTRLALQQSHDALVELASGLNEADLDTLIGTEERPGEEVTAWLTLHGIVQHDAYHAGQIALLRRAMTTGG